MRKGLDHRGELPLLSGERRVTLRLVAYWEKLRGDRPMPSEDEINPDDLADLWDYCFLIHVHQNMSGYRFNYLGSALVDAYQGPLSEKESGRMITPDPAGHARNFAKVLKTRQPLIEEG